MTASINRHDVEAGRVPPKAIENGIMVPPGLQINTCTLAEKIQHIKSCGYPPLGTYPDDWPWVLKTFQNETKTKNISTGYVRAGLPDGEVGL